MLSRRLITFFAVLTAFSLYMIFVESDERFMYLAAICILLGVVSYVGQYQLDWWWYRKYTPKLPAVIEQLFARSSVFYKDLKPSEKQKFDKRTRLFIASKEFIHQGPGDLPEDVRYIVAFAAVYFGFLKESNLSEGYDRIVFYPHPFLSPRFPEDVHICETEHEDGTVIFSTEHLVHGFFEPRKYYPIALHCYAEIFERQYLQDTVIEFPTDVFGTLAQISGIPQDKLNAYMGLPQRYPFPVFAVSCILYPEKVKQVLPDQYHQLSQHIPLP